MSLHSVFYAALNAPMRVLLRSPLHGLASRNLCILRYAGRRSGRRYETPLSFVREGSTVRLLSSQRTRWWTNFLAEETETGRPATGPRADVGYPVEIEIAREVRTGYARAWTEDSPRFREGIRRFLTALPRDAIIYGIKLDGDRKPREADIERAAGHVVLVEITLDLEPDLEPDESSGS